MQLNDRFSAPFILRLLALATVVATSQPALALIEPLKVSSETPFPASRWAVGDATFPQGRSFAVALAEVLKNKLDKDFASCVRHAESAAQKAEARSAGVEAWLALRAIDCASQLSPSEKNADLLHLTLNEADRHPEWFVSGAQATLLRETFFTGLLSGLEQDIKTNRARAAKTVERAEQLLAFASEKLRGRLWYLAGELAFITQKPEGAREFYLRSLSEVESDEVRARLNATESALKNSEAAVGAASASATPNPSSTPLDAGLNHDASDDERELVDRVTAAMKSGDLLSAVSDAIKLINAFPGGTRAKWAADRVMECYGSVSDRTDDSIRQGLSHSKLISLMQNADADRMTDWAKAMSARGAWGDSLLLAEAALDLTKGARITALLDLASRSAMAVDNFSLARKFYDRLILSSAGQPQAREALFRSGLLHFRQAEYVKAGSDFERLLLNPQAGQFELLARYWDWRSLQKQNSNRADDVARELMSKAPFSYYGLRVRIELGSGTLDWKKDPRTFTSRMWLTDTEKKIWNRVLLLLKAGWLDEASIEIKGLPPARKAEDQAVRALLWAASGNYINATKLANEAWDENPELRRAPLVDAAFPKVFVSAVTGAADTRNVDRYLLMGLIKQESGYNIKAISTSNALGLMQMIPPTAKEIAQDLHLGTLTLPDDMFQPQRNIQMGTYYLSRLLTRYQGNVPLALAAYNAGPARIDRWIKSRPSLQKVQSTRSSAPENEVWFDEIPYWETSTYVKAILRNILIYRMLDVGRVDLPDPLWASKERTPASQKGK